MKKQSFTILLVLLISMISTKALAYDIAVMNADGVTIYYNYINDGKELEVAKGSYSGNVVIPEEVTYMNKTRKVTSIGNYAFEKCYDLTSVTIPNSVTSIGDYVFNYCDGLTSVIIPNNMVSIGRCAFQNCYCLTSVTIPNSVTSIGGGAFHNCDGLTSVNIFDIAAWCNIKFGNVNANPLGCAHHLYLNGEEIKDLVIPNSVTSIGANTFIGCSGLTSVTIGNSVTSIGGNAFSYCSGLTSVTIGNSVTIIGGMAFSYCSGLTSIIIPNSVTSIDGAFYKCSGLTSVTIPNSVTSIGDYAFGGCSGLTSVTIPNSVTSIGTEAFGYCSGLTSVTIGNSVTSIGDYAFRGCNLFNVISLIEDPFRINENTFTRDTYYNATLYVPVGTIDKYKATDSWKKFVFIEESDIAGVNVVENTKNNKTTIYDLNGVRQSEPKKGINIVNGKKVVVK